VAAARGRRRGALAFAVALARQLDKIWLDDKKSGIFLVIDHALYQAPEIGSPLRVGEGEAAYWAFAPARMPREVSLGPPTIYLLSEADRAVGALAGLGARLPNPHLLIQPYLRREAVSSTRIEGTQSSLSDVLSAEARLRIETEDQREVLNYVRALERGLARLPDLPLSKRLIREMHAELMSGVRGQERTPGAFRRSQNWIGGTNPSDALFVPPPPSLLEDALDDLETFLQAQFEMPILIKCALAHFQFETIHPFLDGNGRLGRLLIIFYLVERGVLRQPLLYLSSYFEQNREDYVNALQRVRERGDIEAWLRFFLAAVAQQARNAVDSADSLLRLREDFRERLRSVRARGQAIDAAELLIGNPYVTIPHLARDLDVTRQGAQYVVATLERAGIVESVPGVSRPALFVARDVLDVLQRD
jgi:Fic family protein